MRPNARWLGACLVALPAWLLLIQTVNAQQTPPAAKQESAPPAPLARFVARDGLILYAEFAGLDQHANTWKQSSAYRILNETTTGAMLDEIATQILSRGEAGNPNSRLSGPERLEVLKHCLHQGVVLAEIEDRPGLAGYGVVVFRGAAKTRELRQLFGKFMAELARPGAAMSVTPKPGGRRVVLVDGTKIGGKRWAWWPEQDDLVMTRSEPETVDSIVQVLDGKVPNAVEHPNRADLAKPDGDFEPVGIAFFDRATMKGTLPAELKDRASRLGLEDLARLDVRWGCRGKQIETHARIVAPSPRSGMLALLDSPTFDLKSMPPAPEGIDGMTAFSVEPGKLLDRFLNFVKAAPPAPPSQATLFFEHLNEFLATKAKLRLREDLLNRLGPRGAYYVWPDSKKSAASTPTSPPPGGNPMAALLSAGAKVPKFVVQIEMNDPEGLSRALDNLMIQVNKSLHDATAPKEDGKEGDQNRGNSRRDSTSAPEFRVSLGDPKHKMWILTLPPQYGAFTSARPSLILGDQFLIVASDPAVARQALALEVKGGAHYEPGGELADLVKGRADDLEFLRISDPREWLPQSLAAMPMMVQTIGRSPFGSLSPLQAGLGVSPSNGGVASRGGATAGPPGDSSGLSSSAGDSTQATSPPSDPGLSSGGPPPQAPAGGANPAIAGNAPIQVDPSKVPSTEAIGKLLSPGLLIVNRDDREIRIMSRTSFPILLSPPALMGMAQAAEAGAKAAPAKPAGEPVPAPGPAAPGPQAGSSPPGPVSSPR